MFYVRLQSIRCLFKDVIKSHASVAIGEREKIFACLSFEKILKSLYINCLRSIRRAFH